MTPKSVSFDTFQVIVMKRIFISLLCSLPVLGFGQILFYNDGAMVKVQPGAVLFIEGGMQNTATGTIDNDGIIEVQGNFVNAGTWDTGQPNTLRFSGTGNSDVTSGPAVFQTVEDIKTGGGNINLLSPMTVNTDLNFNSAGATRIVTGNFDLILGNTATTTGADADEYVATTGTGMMQKGVTANNTFIFPIGDIVNYSPLSCTYTGSAYAAANLRAKANDLTHPNKPADASDYISRYWDVNQTGITGYNNTMVGTYIPADITGTAGLIKGAVYDGANWAYAGALSGANTVTGSTSVATADFTGTNFFGKVNVMAFLQGPYSAGTGIMTIALNTAGLIPLVSPYADAPATAASIPANVTDWVKLELREVGNPTNIIGKGSAFVKSDGTIVGLDGTSLPLIKNGNPTSLLAVYHRNHLPFRTDVGLDVVNPVLVDFTTDTSSVYNNGVGNNPMNFIIAGNRWVMWSCDAAGTTFLLNATDVNFVKLSTAIPFVGYHKADVNLNSLGNATDVNITKLGTAIPRSADL